MTLEPDIRGMAPPCALRLDRPPPPAARAPFDPGFGSRFAIFADAEEEFDWSRPVSRDARRTTAIAALPAVNRRFIERGVVPTYLVDHPVVDSPASAATIRAMVEDDVCEVGAQLHPWVTPPFDEPVTQANSFAGNLPPALERAKLAALTRRIEEATGRRPRIYRAGRYGVGAGSAALLEDAGYRLDVSVRALFDYRGEGGPDFSACPVWPWWASPNLLELPLTAAFVGRWRARPALHRHAWLRAPLARAGLLNRIALTPEGVPLGEALAAIDRLLDDDVRLFSLSFHTPSVEPGHTPYVRDAADLKRFWAWWDGVLNRFARAGVRAVRGSEIIASARPLIASAPAAPPLSPRHARSTM